MAESSAPHRTSRPDFRATSDPALDEAGMSAFLVGEQRVAVEPGPIMRAVPDEDVVILGASVAETRAFALAALERRLKVIGPATAA